MCVYVYVHKRNESYVNRDEIYKCVVRALCTEFVDFCVGEVFEVFVVG